MSGCIGKLQHRFVEYIPSELEDGIIYVTIEFGTAVHRCCCGCGEEVVTPLSPTDWKLIYDGETVSLYPSVGNWSLPCESHYWIVENNVRWARRWSRERIAAGREFDRDLKQAYYTDGQRSPRSLLSWLFDDNQGGDDDDTDSNPE